MPFEPKNKPRQVDSWDEEVTTKAPKEVSDWGEEVITSKKKVDTNNSSNGGATTSSLYPSQSQLLSAGGNIITGKVLQDAPATKTVAKPFADIFSATELLDQDITANNALTLSTYNSLQGGDLTQFNRKQNSFAGGSLTPTTQEKQQYDANQVKTDKEKLKEYNKKRQAELEEQANLHSLRINGAKVGGGAVDNRGYTVPLEGVDVVEETRKLNETKDYQENLKKGVATHAANIILSNTDLTNFDPVEIGRDIIKISDPKTDAIFSMMEDEGKTLPGVKRAELERLGLNQVRNYLDNNPQTPNKDAALEIVKSFEKDFDERNFELTAATVREKLSQYFYDKDRGGIVGVLGRPYFTESSLKEAVNDPSLGLTDAEKKVALSYVIPIENKITGTFIARSGLLSSFTGAIEKSGVNMGNTIGDVFGGRTQGDQAFEAVDNSSNRYDKVKDRNYWSKFYDGTGDLTGQVAAMAMSGGAIRGAAGKLVGMAAAEKAGLFIGSYLNAFDGYKQQAILEMPEATETERLGYAASLSFLEGATEGIFNDTKILNAFTTSLKPTVKELTQKVISGELTSELAKTELQSGLRNSLKQFGKEYAVSTLENASEEAIMDVAQGVASSVFGGQDFDVIKTGKQALETFATTALYSPIVAGLAAKGTVSQSNSERAFMKSAIVDMAKNPSAYLKAVEDLQIENTINQQEANEKVALIKVASSFLNDMPADKNFDYPTTASYLVHRLNEGILKQKLDAENGKKIPDVNVVNDITNQLKRSEEIRKGIYDGTVQVDEDLNEVTTDEKRAEELGITVIPQEEISKPAVVPLQKSGVTVIQPNEINRPETTTIAPDETLVPDTKETSASVILPQNNNTPNIVSNETETQTQELVAISNEGSITGNEPVAATEESKAIEGTTTQTETSGTSKEVAEVGGVSSKGEVEPVMEYDDTRLFDEILNGAKTEDNGRNLIKQIMDVQNRIYNNDGSIKKTASSGDIALNDRLVAEYEDVSAVAGEEKVKNVDSGNKEFDDWIKGSQVVDDNGKPLVVYHGTQRKFKEFAVPSYFGKVKFASEGGFEMSMGGKSAIFFSSDKESASTYSISNKRKKEGVVKPVFLSIKTPYVIDAQGKTWTGRIADEYKIGLRNPDYDGVIVKNVIDRADEEKVVGTVYVVKSPSQIKVAGEDISLAEARNATQESLPKETKSSEAATGRRNDATTELPKADTQATPTEVKDKVVGSGVGDMKDVYRGSDYTDADSKENYYPHGYYKGVHFFFGDNAKEKAKGFGKNISSIDITGAKLYELKSDKDADALKKEASKNGYHTTEASGNPESEYLKSLGYDGVKRGDEVIIFEPAKFKTNGRNDANDRADIREEGNVLRQADDIGTDRENDNNKKKGVDEYASENLTGKEKAYIVNNAHGRDVKTVVDEYRNNQKEGWQIPKEDFDKAYADVDKIEAEIKAQNPIDIKNRKVQLQLEQGQLDKAKRIYEGKQLPTEGERQKIKHHQIIVDGIKQQLAEKEAIQENIDKEVAKRAIDKYPNLFEAKETFPFYRSKGGHKDLVTKAVKDGTYEKAIANGEMTAIEAAKIITSAKLEVPKSIQEKLNSEQTKQRSVATKDAQSDAADQQKENTQPVNKTEVKDNTVQPQQKVATENKNEPIQETVTKKPTKESTQKKVSKLTKLADDVEKVGAAKAMSEWLKSKKLKGGTMVTVDFGLTKEIYNSAIDFMAEQIARGTKFGKVLANAISRIDKAMGGKKWDKAGFGKEMSKTFVMKVNGKDEVVERDDTKETAEVINGFYSPLEQRILDTKDQTLPANKWLERLKSDEAKWTGVQEFLEGRGTQAVTKSELKDFMKNNRIEIVEVVKGGESTVSLSVRQESSGKYVVIDDAGKVQSAVFNQRAEAEDFVGRNKNSTKLNTKYETYQLAGEKENYKEVLVTLPNDVANKKYHAAVKAKRDYEANAVPRGRGEDIEAYLNRKNKALANDAEYQRLLAEEKKFQDSGTKTDFRSNHWDEPNILVHLRMNERVDAEGNKVLFAEEVQSDWGQKGKKEGFDISAADRKKYQDEYNENKDRRIDIISDIQKAFNEERYDDWKSLNEEDTRLNRRAEELGTFLYNKGVSPSPFVTDTNSWVKLGIKTALKYAVESGASKIAWINGEQSNERYDLSSQINRASLISNGNGKYNLVVEGKDGQEVAPYSRSGKEVTPKELEDVVGKDLAEKLIVGADKGAVTSAMGQKQGRWFDVSGLDLKIGGKGMIGFYGNPSEGKEGIIGGVAKALIKDLTGREGQIVETKLQTTTSVNKSDNPIFQFRDWVWKNKTEDYSYGDAKRDIDNNSELYKNFLSDKSNVQHSIEITPELRESVRQGMPLFGEAKPQSKLRELADKIEKEGILPSWAKANIPDGTQLQGFNLDKAIADALRFIDDAITAGKELSQAIEEGFETIRKHFADNNAKFKDEEQFKKDFTDFVEGNVEQGEKLSGIVLAATAETRKQFGLGEYVKETISDEELNAMADEAIANNFNIEGLLRKLEKGGIPNSVETIILKKYKAMLDGKVEADPSDENLALLSRVVHANDRARSDIGRALRAGQGDVERDVTLGDYFVTEKESAGTDTLTEEQKAKVKNEFEAIKKANEQYEKDIQALRDANNKLKANAIINRVKKTYKKQSKSHEEFVKERKSIAESIKEKWNKAANDNTLTVVPIPYAKQLFAIAPDVAKLTRSLVEEGVTNLTELVDNVHEILKDGIAEITKKDVQDLIAGEYNERTKTKSELAARIKDLRDEAALLNKLELLENGIVPKTEKAKIERNRNITELRSKIKSIQDKMRKEEREANTFYPEEVPSEVSKYQAIITRNENEAKRIQQLIDEGNFEPDVKPTPLMENREARKNFPALYQKALASKDKLIKTKLDREIRLMQQQYANRSKWQRIKDFTLDVLNVPRTIMSSMDFSAPLRQGLIPTISHPMLAANAFVEMFRQAVSQKRFDRWFYDLRQDPEFHIMEKSGLYVADPHDPKLSAKEEVFMNNLAEKIPLVGKMIKGSERAYVAYLNKMRVDLFKQGEAVLLTHGLTLDNSEADYKKLASWVNNATGRGGLAKPLDNAASILNSVFFSPRLIASRLNLLNPVYYATLPPKVRKMALADMGKFVLFGLSVMALTKIDGDDDDKKGVSVETDIRSTDFGKIKYGDTRYDIWGGFQQYARFLGQLFSGESKSLKSGKIQKVDGTGRFGTNRGDIISRFFRGKLAPIPATLVDITTGRTIMGEKVLYKFSGETKQKEITLTDEAKKVLMPLVIQDTYEAIQKEGAKSLFTTWLPATFGIGVQTYNSKK